MRGSGQDDDKDSLQIVICLNLVNWDDLPLGHPGELHDSGAVRHLVYSHVSHYIVTIELRDDSVPRHSLLLGLGDMGEPVPLHGHGGPDLSLVRSYFIKLLIQLELEVHGPELDEPVEEGGGPADVPLLGVLIVCHLQTMKMSGVVFV